MNNTQYKYKCQLKHWQNLQVIPNLEFVKNPNKLIKNLTEFQKTILDIFIALDNRYKNIHIMQETISKIVGCCRKTVNETIIYFNKIGLMATLNRGVKKTCLYKISQFFLCPENRQRLKKYFKSLKLFSIAWLFSYCNYNKLTEVTQYYTSNSCLFINKTVNCSLVSNSLQEKERTSGNNKEKEGANMEAIKQIQKTYNLPDTAVEQLGLFNKDALNSAWKFVSQNNYLKKSPKHLLEQYILMCRQSNLRIDWSSFGKVKASVSTISAESPVQPVKKTVKEQPVTYPNVWISKDRQQNIEMWNKWELEHGKLFAEYYGQEFLNSERAKFMEKLYTRNEEDVARWNKNAQFYRDILKRGEYTSIIGSNLNKDDLSLKVNQSQSTNYQQEEKLSSNLNVVDILQGDDIPIFDGSNLEEVYD